MDKLTRNTVCGTVKGAEDEFGTLSWKGLPYARPPVGSLRWKAPREPEPWESVREAAEFGPFATQFFTLPDLTRLDHVYGREDCLYLNIWRPDTGAEGLPVYLWIHGGSNNTGRSNDYSGANLAGKKNMIVVTNNYRLGPFGWFSHPALKTGDPLDDSGNFGLLDSIQALKWIKRNIEVFGGDPERITVGGESAGADNTINLLASPLAKGLFHRAVAQSGSHTWESRPEEGAERVEQNITRLLIRDGIPAGDTAKIRERMNDQVVSDYLRSKSAEEIMISQLEEGGVINGYNSFMDGVVIPGSKIELFGSGNYNRVPVMLGTNENEWKFFMPLIPPFAPGMKDYAMLKDVLWNQGKTLEEALPEGEAREEYEDISRPASMVWIMSGADSIARQMKKYQGQVYVYRFQWGSKGVASAEYEAILGAAHSMEISFFMGHEVNLYVSSTTGENRKGKEALSRDMQRYLSSFVDSGNPNGPLSEGLPEWEAWSNEKGGPKAMILNANLETSRLAMTRDEMTVEKIKRELKRMKPEVAAVAQIHAGLFFPGWDEE
jgi:para-nitrobenzyl esterase